MRNKMSVVRLRVNLKSEEGRSAEKLVLPRNLSLAMRIVGWGGYPLE
jgi:hypothetical protein